MIINSCPVSLPSDIDQPQPLTPGMLLTMNIRRLAPMQPWALRAAGLLRS